ncbi:hypothetical protein ETSB_0049 [cyanobacterium endosymbiont of Epithemia turgida isolate EtSB Lake Yunoko]|nr:hypothetical protein ETSB_0049 [cyanobacterium endosymbiont of Epithemia turgida isolate EtSB Lake Yunoko]
MAPIVSSIYIHWLFGPFKRLSAQIIFAIKERPDPKDNSKLKPVNTDDTSLLMLELNDGVPCQVSLSSLT